MSSGLCGRFVEIDQNHLAARIDQRPRRCGTKAGRAAGNEEYVVLNPHGVLPCLLLWGSKPESSLDSDGRAAMVDLFNLPDRFGQWQKAITGLPIERGQSCGGMEPSSFALSLEPARE
ncbi:MAG: hypothetical protein ACOZF1_05270 [Pseudomonadota bacterium]